MEESRTEGSEVLYENKQPRVEFYTGEHEKWRWRLWFSSDIVASSSQGYSSKEAARENFFRLESHVKWLRENGGVDE